MPWLLTAGWWVGGWVQDDVTGEEKQAFDQPFLDRLMTVRGREAEREAAGSKAGRREAWREVLQSG